MSKTKIEYKLIDTKKPSGLREAEKLKREGWKIGNVGFWVIQFYKESK
jgi:hypothetical protein